jgi:hypothetical protein
VSRNTRLALTVAVSLLFAVAVKTIVAFARFPKAEREFASIQNGESRSSVIARLGIPNYHAGRCGVIHFPDKNCAVEYVYSHPFAPLVPEYYIVSFSSDDRVIEADQWDSP